MNTFDSASIAHRHRAAAQENSAEISLEQASIAVCALVRKLRSSGTVVAFAGAGMNGDRALLSCIQLAPEYECQVFVNDTGTPTRHALITRAQKSDVTLRPFVLDSDERVHALKKATLIIDALGTMLDDSSNASDNLNRNKAFRDSTNFLSAIIQDIRQAGNCPVVALEMSSGIDLKSGLPIVETPLEADHTIAFGLLPVRLFLAPLHRYRGALWFAEIGSNDWMKENCDDTRPAYSFAVLRPSEAHAMLPQRAFDAEKRSAGAPLIIAGSVNFPGAAILCARGAARMGAGYVTLATPQENANVLRHHLVEQVVIPFDETQIVASVKSLVKLSTSAAAIAIGPGLPRTDAMREILLGLLHNTEIPVVIDATALHLLRDDLALLQKRVCVLTPHAAEFAVLAGTSIPLDHERIPRLRDFVEQYGIVTLLKGQPSLIAAETMMSINPTGTAALATAGSGDVLTGMISTLLAQGLGAQDAACLGAYIHGLAGQVIEREKIRGMISGDLPEALQYVWHALRKVNQHHSSSGEKRATLERLDDVEMVVSF